MKKLSLAFAVCLALIAGASSCKNGSEKSATTNEGGYMIEQTKPDADNAARAQQFLKKCGTYYLATEENGQPRVRPFGTAEIFEGKLYIQTGKVKNVYKQLVANPRAEICGFTGGEWIRIQCELIPDERIEAKRDMLDKNPSLRGMYKEDDDNTIVLYMRNATATISSFTSEPKVFQF
jgi:uncharacterized pyridoxamine 5'-phosphate oxidase family protein